MTKEAILGAIRRGLRRGELPGDQQAMLRDRMAHPPRQLIPRRSQVPRPEQVALLIRNIEKDFGTLECVPDGDAVPQAVAGYLAQNNLPSMLAMAPHPELQAMPWSSRPLLLIREGRALPTDLVSVQQAFAAVAETGTLMLPSDPERPTTLNLLSDTAIVVLRTSRVVGPYEDAWDLLRRERQDAVTGGFMPRNVMLVTGPSRSADIEQTLELGAHGPRRLHVVLIEDDPAARAG
ncbi:MAG TPA: LUD domain-containing protein [Acetobacteraceae bacterium]